MRRNTGQQRPPRNSFLQVSALLCFSHTFSHLFSAAITHHPRPTTNIQDRMKVPSCTHCQAHKEVQEEIIFKSHHICRSSTSTSHPSLVFFPDKEAGKYSPFSRSPDKTTPLLGIPSLLWALSPAPSSLPSSHCPCVTPNEPPKPSAEALVNFSKRKGSQNPELQPPYNL